MLVKAVLAMRPDLIVVGEVRGAEAFELTRAANAGCGFACTVHANSAADALNALVSAALMAGENVSERVVQRVFASAIDLVVHVDREALGEDRGGPMRQVREIISVMPGRQESFSTSPLFSPLPPGRTHELGGGLPSRVSGFAYRKGNRVRARSDIERGGAAEVKWIAALSSGVFSALFLALLMGFRPRLRVPRPRRRSGARELWLAQAGLNITPVQFTLASVGVGAVALVVLLGVSGVWVVAAPPAVVIALGPRLYFARVRTRRLSEVRRAWPDGIRDVVGGVASGMSVQRAVENLARSGPAPLREAFRRFPMLARTLGVMPALDSIKEDLADPTSDRVIEVLMIAHERGGVLIPEILRDLADSTSMDLAATEEEQTEALEQRINARVVFMLPWLVLVALTFRPGPFRTFYSSPAGVVVVAIGAGLSLLGIALISRLSRPQEEPRVLTASAGETGPW